MMMKRIALLLIIVTVQGWLLSANQKAQLIHNTLGEIDACKSRLQLKLTKVWGGAEEEDEQKFFETPTDIVIDSKNRVYICDQHNHCIKIFDRTGKYLRTIGRKGRGPGDVYSPKFISISPEDELVVYELGGRRFQWFSPNGQTKKIVKHLGWLWWTEVNKNNEIALYNHKFTLNALTLVTYLNREGKDLRNIGTYHDKSRDFVSSEKLKIAMDESDNVYIGNDRTPVIRKYSPDGKLLMAITFETPIEVPVKITINPGGTEIVRHEADIEMGAANTRESENNVKIQLDKKKGIQRYGICEGIAVDAKNRLFVVTRRRTLSQKEIMATAVSGNMFDKIRRNRVNFDIVENIDANRLLVFGTDGKVVAEAQLSTFCDNIYIHGTYLFVIDGTLNQRILEYEMIFK